MATCPSCRTTYDGTVTTCPKDGAALLPESAFLNADIDLVAGDKVGEYKVEGKLGQGGFGAVFKGVHPLIGKQVAIKVLNRQFSSNPQMVSRFIAEARAVNQIGHRNIIDIFSFGVLADGRQYYVMELLGGMTLDKLMSTRGALPIEESLAILRAVARALDAAHAKGIAHRDLKPENIYVASDDDGAPFPKLLDFGIAKLLGSDERSTHKTNTGVPIGTPYYMSPEQGRGVGVDHRTDYYAFGVMAYELLAGRLPFEGENYMDVLMRHMMDAPPAPSTVSGLPVALDAPILRFLEKDPAKRPASVTEGLRALEDAARGLGVPVPIARTSGMATPTPAPSLTGGPRTPSPDGSVGSLPTLAATDTLNDLRGSVLGAPPSKPARSGLVLGLAGLAIAGAAALIVVKVMGGDRAPNASLAQPGRVAPVDAATRAPSPDAAAAVAISSLRRPDAAPVTVKVDLEGTPPGAEVVLDGRVLGRVPGPITLVRSELQVSLEIRARGYRTTRLLVTPSADDTRQVKLERAKKGGKKPDGKKPDDGVGDFDD